MFNTIVWATDGSEAADRAVPYVSGLAQLHGASVTALHVVERIPGPYAGTARPDQEDVQSKIEAQVAALGEEGIEAGMEIVGGSTVVGAAHVIADFAAKGGADLIIVGTRGHTALSGLLLGSVTQRLLQIASCPVLTVPDGPVAAEGKAEPAEATPD
jgi:nucleotide-binding universal stress UspA family protein